MLRILMLAAFTLVATPALAAKGEPTTTELKQDVKEAKRFSKKLTRYGDRWERAVAKKREGKVARLDGKLAGLYQAEIVRLRGLGIPTRPPPPEPLRIHPGHPDVLPTPPPPEHPKLEALRDTVVALKDLQKARRGSVNVKPKEKRLLNELQASASARYERMDKRLERL